MTRGETYEIFLLGDEGVGKLSIANRFGWNAFGTEHFHDDYDFSKRLKISLPDNNGVVFHPRVDIIHAPGIQRKDVRMFFMPQTPGVGVQGALIIYSVTSRESFINVSKYIDHVRGVSTETGYRPWALFLVGNKLDCGKETREVSTTEGEELASSLGIGFLEISAKIGENVDEAFCGLVREMWKLDNPESKLDLGGGNARRETKDGKGVVGWLKKTLRKT